MTRRVAIIGGGFGGIAAARELRHADAEVTVVDRTNHQLFQPLLYQVASGALSLGDISTPIRGLLTGQANASVLMARATGFDVGDRQVILDRGERLSYDSLILACGAETSYFGNDEWQEVSFGLKTLADAAALRNQVFAAFEEAERAHDPAARDRWMTFVVVGGGPTGVEVAGQLAVLSRHTLKRNFSRIDPARTRVILLDAGDRVVPAFRKSLSAKAARELASLGVTVREGNRATALDAEGLTVKTPKGEERIDARTVIWAAGVRAVGLAAKLAEATGAKSDRAGRIMVEPDLTIPGHPEVSAIGDATTLAGKGGKPLPGLATVAIQQGRHVARGIRRGHPAATGPFRYLDKGSLAVVGRGRAVCEIRGLGLSGLPAFLTYLGVHLYYLGGVRGRRLDVLNAWAHSGTSSRQNRVVEGELPPASATGDDRR